MGDLDQAERAPKMGKEAKFGLAAILALFLLLGLVVAVRVGSPGRGRSVDLGEDGRDADCGESIEPKPREDPVAPEAGSVAKARRDAAVSSSGRDNPSVAGAPEATVLSPEHPEPSASGAARWRQLAAPGGRAATGEDTDSGSGASYMPMPPRPVPDEPGKRYGGAPAAPEPPDAPAGLAAVATDAESGEPPDSGSPDRLDAPPAGGSHRERHGDPDPPGRQQARPDRTPRQEEADADSSRTISGGRFAVNSDPNAGRRGDGTYEVQPNDSFWTISEKLYGTGAYFQALAEHNRGKVADRNRLQVGQIVAAPDVAELEQKYPAFCPKPEHRHVARHHTASVRTGHEAGYTVVEGDTLYRIARYELGDASRWYEVYKLNQEVIGESFNHLRPGTQLILPDKTGAEPTDTLTRRPGSLY